MLPWVFHFITHLLIDVVVQCLKKKDDWKKNYMQVIHYIFQKAHEIKLLLVVTTYTFLASFMVLHGSRIESKSQA